MNLTEDKAETRRGLSSTTKMFPGCRSIAQGVQAIIPATHSHKKNIDKAVTMCVYCNTCLAEAIADLHGRSNGIGVSHTVVARGVVIYVILTMLIVIRTHGRAFYNTGRRTGGSVATRIHWRVHFALAWGARTCGDSPKRTTWLYANLTRYKKNQL